MENAVEQFLSSYQETLQASLPDGDMPEELLQDYTFESCLKKDPEGKKAKFAKGFTRLVQKGKMTQEEVDEILSRVTFGGLDIAADADLVVESALEDMNAKIEVFKKLDSPSPS